MSLAFGLTVVTGAYALGHISGGHFNPAVTLGVLTAAHRGGEAAAYVGAQVVGGILGMAILVAIASGIDGFRSARARGESTLAANGWAQLARRLRLRGRPGGRGGARSSSCW